MALDDVPNGDWLHQGTSDPDEVSNRYDEWAEGYDDDLTAWSYQAPPWSRRASSRADPQVRRSTSGAAPGSSAGHCGHGGSRVRSGAYDSVEHADLQQRLPVEGDSVDALVSVGVMTCLPDVEAVWRELARVTRRGD